MTKIEKQRAKQIMEWVANGDTWVIKVPPHTTSERIAKNLSSVMEKAKSHLSKKGAGVFVMVTRYSDGRPTPIDGLPT